MHDIQQLVRKQLFAAWRYRWLAIIFSWMVCAVGWTMVMRIPNVFEASGRLYVDTDAILTPLLRGLTVDSKLQAQVELLQRTLLSRPALEKLISKTDLELQTSTQAEKDALAMQLATEIRIVPQTSNLFVFSYRNPSPKLAYDVVQAMVTAFIESKAGNNRADLANAAKFLDSQISLYERQLREAERRKAEFRAKYLDVLPQDGGVSKLEGANAAVKTLQGQLVDAQGRKVSLAKELASTPPMLVAEPEAVGAGGMTRLQQAELKLDELRLSLTDKHPDVIAQRQMIAALKAGQLGQLPVAPGAPTGSRSRSVPNPVYEQVKTRLVDTDGQIASFQRQLDEQTQERDRLNAIARGVPGLLAESININRDYDILRRNYDELLSRREQMRISSAAEASADNVKVQLIDPPIIPRTPVAPKRMLLLTGVLGAGLAAGLGLALLLVQFDQSFHSTDDLRGLGYPVVGGVSMLAVARPLLRQVFAVGTVAVAAIIPCVVYGGLILTLLRQGTSA